MKHAEIIRTIWEENKKTLPTQKELAKRLDIHASRLSRFMKGHDDLRGEELMQLIKELPDHLRLECWLRIGKELKIDIATQSPNSGGREGGNIDEKMQAIAEDIGESADVLRELLDSMPNAIKNAVQKVLQGNNLMNFHEMIQQCLSDWIEDDLKARLEDVETVSRSGITWKEFQSILDGEYPSTVEKLETIVGTLDPDDKIDARLWRAAWERERPQNSSLSSTDHLISNGH